MEANNIKTYAIFSTDGPNTLTHLLQYVAKGEDEKDAFDAFDDDILSNTGEESGWDWHVYEIPSDIADNDDAIYDYVDERRPTTITS